MLRALLPTLADLRRVVRSPYARSFAIGYRGFQLELRTTPVSDAIIRASFEEADPRASVIAWGASTAELAMGGGQASRFPDAMRRFAREISAPGGIWLLLELWLPAPSGTVEYVAFARLGDRFLWIRDPWTVPVIDERALEGGHPPPSSVSAAPFPPPRPGPR